MNKKESLPQDEYKGSEPFTEKEMNDLLLDLGKTAFWRAIQQFVAMQSINAENALCSIDPFKFPTDMARNQGIRIGLMALDNYIKEEIARRREKNKGQTVSE